MFHLSIALIMSVIFDLRQKSRVIQVLDANLSDFAKRNPDICGEETTVRDLFILFNITSDEYMFI